MQSKDYFPELGRPMKASEVAKALDIAPNTVLKYADRLGAFRIGGRTLFFEKRILEVIDNGIEDLKERSNPMESPRSARRGDTAKTVRHQGRGPGLGIGHEKVPDLGSPGASECDSNRHGLDVGE